MTIALSISGGVQCKTLSHIDPSRKHVVGSLAMKTTCRFGQSGLKTTPHFGVVWSQDRDVREKKRHIKSSIGDGSSPLSPSKTVKELYNCINEGNFKQLRNYIATECHLEECSFIAPFENREEVLLFFKELIECLGQNVKFKINQVCEGDQLVAVANWHLEWKSTQIPLTRGCSFFECSNEGDKIKIKRARIVSESPIKPGGLVLSLLKIVTTVFDNFPTTTQRLLKSVDIIQQWFTRNFMVFFKIFINPILKIYSRFWILNTLFLNYMFRFTMFILKFFIH